MFEKMKQKMKERETKQKEKSKERAIKQKDKEDRKNEEYLRTHWRRLYSWEIPKWLLEKTKGDMTGVFKGKVFVYKITYTGGKTQGEGHCIYYRRLRSDVKYDPSKYKEGY
jgi:hypothetical protein